MSRVEIARWTEAPAASNGENCDASSDATGLFGAKFALVQVAWMAAVCGMAKLIGVKGIRALIDQRFT